MAGPAVSLGYGVAWIIASDYAPARRDGGRGAGMVRLPTLPINTGYCSRASSLAGTTG
ncbi:hypothetical protein ACLK19_03930 [Escherichia coli]